MIHHHGVDKVSFDTLMSSSPFSWKLLSWSASLNWTLFFSQFYHRWPNSLRVPDSILSVLRCHLYNNGRWPKAFLLCFDDEPCLCNTKELEQLYIDSQWLTLTLHSDFVFFPYITWKYWEKVHVLHTVVRLIIVLFLSLNDLHVLINY